MGVLRMAKTPFVLLGALLLGATGCSDKEAGRSAAPPQASQSTNVPIASAQRAQNTNKVSLAEAFPGASSNELFHLKACIESIDKGRNSFAMRHARELMDSKDVDIRLQAVEAFGWIGRFAVNELAEMMADADEIVSSEALRRWELAFGEISSESGKMQAIEKAAMLLKRQDSLDAVMMKFAELEDYSAVQALSRIITSTNASPVAVEVARAEYASLAGEPFVDAGRAAQVAKTLKDRAEGIVPEPPKEQALKTQQGKEKHEHVH